MGIAFKKINCLFEWLACQRLLIRRDETILLVCGYYDYGARCVVSLIVAGIAEVTVSLFANKSIVNV
jgi:hypothetical protein